MINKSSKILIDENIFQDYGSWQNSLYTLWTLWEPEVAGWAFPFMTTSEERSRSIVFGHTHFDVPAIHLCSPFIEGNLHLMLVGGVFQYAWE